MKLPLQLMLRKLHHLQRWEADIEQHLIDCKVDADECSVLRREKKECAKEMEQLRRDIAVFRRISKRTK